jgi:hypothetical protein
MRRAVFRDRQNKATVKAQSLSSSSTCRRSRGETEGQAKEAANRLKAAGFSTDELEVRDDDRVGLQFHRVRAVNRKRDHVVILAIPETHRATGPRS